MRKILCTKKGVLLNFVNAAVTTRQHVGVCERESARGKNARVKQRHRVKGGGGTWHLRLTD